MFGHALLKSSEPSLTLSQIRRWTLTLFPGRYRKSVMCDCRTCARPVASTYPV